MPAPRWRAWGFIAALAAIGGVVIWALTGSADLDGDRDRQIRFVAGAVWLAVLVPPLILSRRHRVLTLLRDAVAWLAVIAVIVLGYAYRFELGQVWSRVKGELLPQTGIVAGERAVQFRLASDGHFHVEAEVDGKPIRFMVDTGASDVVLTAADARRLGLDPGGLSFDRVYRTANGQVLGAPVLLREVRIGPIVLSRVRASVSQGEMGQSLLGMSFLERLGGYAVENGTLTLRQ